MQESKKLGFPTGQKFLVPRDKGTDMLLLSRDKGTAGQGNLFCPGTKGQRDNLKILPRDRTGRDFRLMNSFYWLSNQMQEQFVVYKLLYYSNLCGFCQKVECHKVVGGIYF